MYWVISNSKISIREQRASYDALVGSLRKGTPAEINAALAEREASASDDEISPAVVNKLKRHIKAKSRKG